MTPHHFLCRFSLSLQSLDALILQLCISLSLSPPPPPPPLSPLSPSYPCSIYVRSPLLQLKSILLLWKSIMCPPFSLVIISHLTSMRLPTRGNSSRSLRKSWRTTMSFGRTCPRKSRLHTASWGTTRPHGTVGSNPNRPDSIGMKLLPNNKRRRSSSGTPRKCGIRRWKPSPMALMRLPARRNSSRRPSLSISTSALILHHQFSLIMISHQASM